MAVIRREEIDCLYRWDHLTGEQKQEFRDWMKNTGVEYVDPGQTILAELEKSWEAFLLQNLDHRHKAEAMMIKYIDASNEEVYEGIRKYLYSMNFPTEINYQQRYIQSIQGLDEAEYVQSGYENDSSNDVNVVNSILANPKYKEFEAEAIDFEKSTGYIIITPSTPKDQLDERYRMWQCMLYRHRVISDNEALRLFGLTNQRIYAVLVNSSSVDIDNDGTNDYYYPGSMRQYYNALIDDDDYEMTELVESFAKYAKPDPVNPHNSWANVSGTISQAIQKLKSVNEDIVCDLDMGIDAPYYPPDNMIDLGVFNAQNPELNMMGVSGMDDIIPSTDVTRQQWFEMYKMVYYGLPMTEEYKKINSARVRQLEYLSNVRLEADDISDEEVKKINQTILELGWNPYMEFNEAARTTNDKLVKRNFKDFSGRSQIINCCGLEIPETLQEAEKKNPSGTILKPIFIVLQEGNMLLSKAIKVVTQGPYSHASIAFDPECHEMYSYTAGSHNPNGIKGGIIKEKISYVPEDCKLGIFCVFVEEQIFDKIKENVEYLYENAKSTMYHFGGLLTILFQIPVEWSKTMICSQFVDRMLKLGGLDLTNKKSSLVDPNFLAKVSKANKKIFKVFDGLRRNFRPVYVRNKVIKLNNPFNKFQEGTLPFDATVGSSFHDIATMATSYDAMRAIREAEYSAESMKVVLEYFYSPFDNIETEIDKRVPRYNMFDPLFNPCQEAYSIVDEMVNKPGKREVLIERARELYPILINRGTMCMGINNNYHLALQHLINAPKQLLGIDIFPKPEGAL